ncbi:MAG: hypothetical protein RBU37_14585 [Myxococcota bacterium]|jgi:hypothetical protein|nr:hypothetical protein [Myxococcota bacterium]
MSAFVRVSLLLVAMGLTLNACAEGDEPQIPPDQSTETSDVIDSSEVPDSTDLDTSDQDLNELPDQDLTELPDQDVTDTPDQDVLDLPDEDVTDLPDQDVTDLPDEDVVPDEDVTELPDQDVEPDVEEDDTIPVTCDRQGFAPVLEFAETAEGFLMYEAIDAEGEPYNYLYLELLWGFATETEVLFADENYNDCITCLNVEVGCTSESCEKRFLAYAGSLDLEAWGAAGTNLQATLRHVELREVVFEDPENPFVSTPVPDGEIYCIDELHVDVLLDEM